MMRLVKIVVAGSLLFIQPAELLADTITALRDGRNVLIATNGGEVQGWEKGSSNPSWSIALEGKSSLRIALMQDLGNGQILVAEQGGTIHMFNYNSPSKIDHDWDTQVVSLDEITAAAMNAKGLLFLASSKAGGIHQIAALSIRQQGKGLLPVGKYLDQSSLGTDKLGGESALAVCDKATLVGTMTGTLSIVPKASSFKKHGRIHQLADDRKTAEPIEGAGCLSFDLAYTVSDARQSNNGQVQLWDLQNDTLLHSVDAEPNGEPPLLTFAAVASADGTRLLGLGDLRLRVWSVKSRRLVLLGKQFISNMDANYAAAPLPNGQFLLYDGVTLWTVSADGKSKEYFAGQRP